MIRALYIIGKWAVQDLACYLAGRSGTLDKSKQQSEDLAETRKEAARAREQAEDSIKEARRLRAEINNMVDYVDSLSAQLKGPVYKGGHVGRTIVTKKGSHKFGYKAGQHGTVVAYEPMRTDCPYIVDFGERSTFVMAEDIHVLNEGPMI